MTEFAYSDLLPLGPDTTEYRLISTEGISTFEADGRTFLKIEPSAIRLLTRAAMNDIAHYLRTEHLEQLASILEDPEASGNDIFVAHELLLNANIAAAGVLPMCQDTGTAIVMGKKGDQVVTYGDDGEAISAGVFDTYTETNLRYSQLAPVSMFEEKNTGNNLPAQIELYTKPGSSYEFLFMAKGGGSANKSFLFQKTKALLNEESLLDFLDESLRAVGTSACPAVSPRARGRRNLSGVQPQDRQAGLRPLPRHAAHVWKCRHRPRLPRHRMGSQGAGADSRIRYRSSIRRKVLLS